MIAVKTPIAVFARDGQTRQAYSAGEATSLRNAGWSPVVGETGPEPVSVSADVTVLSNDETVAAVAASTAAQPQPEPSPNKQKDQA